MSSTLSRLDSRECGPGELAAGIRNCHRGHLRELWLEVVLGGVVICGVATSSYGKQLALREVRRRCGLRVAANRIVVVEAVPAPVLPSDPFGG